MSNIIPMYGYDVNNKGVRLSIISTQKWVGKNCFNGYFEFAAVLHNFSYYNWQFLKT